MSLDNAPSKLASWAVHDAFGLPQVFNLFKCLRIHPEIVVWILDTSDNNFGIKNHFTKYLKESCW